jgi:hypothetical protein
MDSNIVSYSIRHYVKQEAGYIIFLLKCLVLETFILNHERVVQFYGRGYEYLIRVIDVCECSFESCEKCNPVGKSIENLFGPNLTKCDVGEYVIKISKCENENILTKYLKSVVILKNCLDYVRYVPMIPMKFFLYKVDFKKLEFKQDLKTCFYKLTLMPLILKNLKNVGRTPPTLMIPKNAEYIHFSSNPFEDLMLLYIMVRYPNKELETLFAIYFRKVENTVGHENGNLHSHYDSLGIKVLEIATEFTSTISVKVGDLLEKDSKALSVTIPNALKFYTNCDEYFIADTLENFINDEHYDIIRRDVAARLPFCNCLEEGCPKNATENESN